MKQKNFQNESNNQRPRNLKNKGDDYSDTELTIIFCVIYFSFLVWEFDSDPSKSGKYTQRFTEAGAGSYIDSNAVVKQLINECSSSRLKDEFETLKRRTKSTAMRKQF